MLRIAVVDDNPSEAQMLEMALRETGEPLQIDILEDGVAAMDYLAAKPTRCDLVLLDLNLPRLTGFEVLERLRRDDRFKGLPVVILSGSSNSEEILRCYRAGANSYICKPLHLGDIIAMAGHVVDYWAKTVNLPSRLQTLRSHG
jgi:CheY-like chemotaxis protein